MSSIPSVNGSYSIKYVLRALVPEIVHAYKQLDSVQNGGEAMNAYSKLDMLAMVRVHQKLKEVTQ